MEAPNDPNGGPKRPVCAALNYELCIMNYELEFMKAMSKQQLADRAGVSVQTLMNWCRPFRQELETMGLQPNAKLLPPHIVQFLTEKFAIDV